MPSLDDNLRLKPGYYLRNDGEEGICWPVGQDSPLSSKTLELSVVGTKFLPTGSETELTHLSISASHGNKMQVRNRKLDWSPKCLCLCSSCVLNDATQSGLTLLTSSTA